MNLQHITEVLHQKIATISDTQEAMLLAKAAEKLNLGNVKVVDSLSDLDAETGVENYQLYFVEDDEALYYYLDGLWNSILYTNDTVWAWGVNTVYQLGDGTTISRTSPVSVITEFTDWVEIKAADGFTIGLRANGTLWSWGVNTFGQLGDGTATLRISPVSVIGGFTDWIQISAHTQHTLALRSDRTLWAWGNNGSGRLGDNTATNRSSPISVVGGFTDWIQVSAGSAHSLGLRDNGTAWAWGQGFAGKLGDGTTTNRSSPVSVVGGFTSWIRVEAGNAGSIGLLANGNAYAWGSNTSGQLTRDPAFTTSVTSPVSIMHFENEWIDVSINNATCYGKKTDGTVWAWGNNMNGELGANSAVVTMQSVLQVAGGFTDWVRIEGGTNFAIGVRANGTIWTWGLNTDGRLGDGTTTTRSSPVSAIGGFTDWVSASAGNGFVAAIRSGE